MNSKDISCFIRVYERRSISAAARELYLSPQAVSKMIQRLESELDAELFGRTSSGLTPTVYGTEFYRHALRMQEEYQNCLQELHRLKMQNEGILKMVSAFGILRLLSPEFIRRFTEKNPDVQIDYMEFPDRYIEERVLEEEYDFGLTPYLYQDPNLEYTPLFSREIFFITGKGGKFYGRSEVSVHDIAGEPLVLENRNFVIHHIMTDLCERENCGLNVYFNTSGFSLCYKLCKEGKADTVSMDFIFDDMGDAGLAMIPFREHPVWNVALVTRKGQPLTDNMRKFIDYAKAVGRAFHEEVH